MPQRWKVTFVIPPTPSCCTIRSASSGPVGQTQRAPRQWSTAITADGPNAAARILASITRGPTAQEALELMLQAEGAQPRASRVGLQGVEKVPARQRRWFPFSRYRLDSADPEPDSRHGLRGIVRIAKLRPSALVSSLLAREIPNSCETFFGDPAWLQTSSLRFSFRFSGLRLARGQCPAFARVGVARSADSSKVLLGAVMLPLDSSQIGLLTSLIAGSKAIRPIRDENDAQAPPSALRVYPRQASFDGGFATQDKLILRQKKGNPRCGLRQEGSIESPQ